MGFALRADPAWGDAARDLVAGLARLEGAEPRIALLERVCLGLGDALYPAFLQILLVVERRGDAEARRRVAGALVDCLVTGRLPEGRLAAWGASSLALDDAFGRPRRLGPVEFLCAWHAQPNQLPTLARERFDAALAGLLTLTSSEPRAAELYAAKLAADARDPVIGSLAGQTRDGLGALAKAWTREGPGDLDAPAATRVLEAFHAASAPGDLLERAARPAPPELGR